MNSFPQNNNANLQDKISKLLIFIAVYTFLFVFFISTIKYTLPFVLASLFALILKSPIKVIMKNFKCKAWLASLLATILFFLMILFLISLIILSLSNEIVSLAKELQILLSTNSSYHLNDFPLFMSKILDSLTFSDLYTWNTLSSTILDSVNKLFQIGLSGFSSMITSILSIFIYIPYIGMSLAFTILATYFMNIKFANLNSKTLTTNLTTDNYKTIFALKYAKKTIMSYILNFIFLIFMSASITFIGFTFLNLDFALLLSLCCAILDVLPVIGIACVYIPLSIYFFLSGDLFTSIAIIVLYLIVFFSRQLLEPKLISSSLGISPLSTLIAMFVGFQLWGVIGIVFCVFLLVFYKILIEVEIL